MNAEKITRWFLVVLGVLSFGASTWYEFLRYDEEFEIRAQSRGEQFEQKLKDCRGSFAERYDCKSEAIRERRGATFKIWANRLSVIFIPPFVVFLGYIGVMALVERRREAARIRRRRKRFFGK